MRAREFLLEAVADDIVSDLNSIGFDQVKKNSGLTVTVYVPVTQRKSVINQIVNKLKGAVHDINVPGSSLGGIKYLGGTIKVKPLQGTGSITSGIQNEKHLVDTIKKFVAQVGPLDLTFLGDNGKSITAQGVTDAIQTGFDTADRKKSDVQIVANGQVVPISIKKSNAEYWESAESYFGPTADVIIDRLYKEGKIQLVPLEQKRSDGTRKVKISPEVAVKATQQQTQDVVFGSDILSQQGAVIKDTFEDEHYTLTGNKLTVTTDLVIRNIADIPPHLEVYFLIRNDVTKNRPNSKYPGIRVLATYAKRVRAHTLIVDNPSAI